MWKYHGENPPRWLITTGSNPESMESTGTSFNDKVQSDWEALNAPIPESEAIGNTTTSGVTAPAQFDGESAPQRSSHLHQRPEQYGDGHLGQPTFEGGGSVTMQARQTICLWSNFSL